MRTIIRRCSKRDIPELLKVFADSYSHNPRMQEADYLEWQFGSGSPQQYNIWAVERDARIVSILGWVPVEFRYMSEIRQGCWPQNWLSIGNDFSGLTVLMKLMEEYENLFYIGLSENVEPIFRKLNVPILSRMPRWIGILDAVQAIKLFKIENARDREAMVRSESVLKDLGKKMTGLHRCARFDPDEEFLFDQWPDIVGYSRRTGAYLNWRYFDIPRHNYRALRNEREFAVYRIEGITGYPWAVVRVLEWSFAEDSSREAMAYMVEDGLKNGAILIDFFCTAREIGSEFGSLGFLEEGRIASVIPYLFRPIHDGAGVPVAIDMEPHREKREVDFGRWYITKGDGDADRIKL